MDREDSKKLAQLTAVASIAFVIAMLYLAQAVLQPLIMSILLTFLLAPLASRLENLKLGRVPAVLATIGLVGLVLLGVGWVVTGQLIELTRKLPEYQVNLSAKIQSVRGADNEMLSEASAMVARLVGEASVGLDAPGEEPVGDAPRPVPVTVVESAPLPVRILRDWLGPALSPFATLAIILVFLVFMLIYREDLRDRVIRLAGTGRLSVTTQALDEAGRRVSSYLLKLLIVNSTYGLSVAIGLWAIGVPSPFLWGLLAAILRFIPYVGPWIAAAMPVALSLAAFEGWGRPLATISLFVVLELVSNNIIEPWLYGRGTGVSVVGIISAALFWTWLWGPLGLVLAMPLTVCLTVLGRYMPGLAYVNVLFSDQPALEIKLRFYQRLLSLDYHDASSIVDEFLMTGSVEDLYSSVLIPSLSLAERDRQNGHLVDAQRQFIYKFIRDTIEEFAGAHQFGAHPFAGRGQVAGDEAQSPVVPTSSEGPAHHVLCLPAEDDGDELASEIVAQALIARGYSARTLTSKAVREGLGQAMRSEVTHSVVISAAAPGGALSARELCRRLRLESGELRLVVGLWNAAGELVKTRERLAAAGANGVATRLVDAVDLLQQISDTKAAPSSAG